MRTKLFFAFLLVIVTALVSNLIYQNFITKDFEEYVSGKGEDNLYRVLASVEGCYTEERWDNKALNEAVRWAMMLGFEVKITDNDGSQLITSEQVFDNLSPSMQRRMKGIVDIYSALGEYEHYPVYREEKEIGNVFIRSLRSAGGVNEKTEVFKKRGREFLILSFVISGGGALLLAIFFSLFLSRPLKRMKNAVEALAQGDFSVRVPVAGERDEIGKLSASVNLMAEALQREDSIRKHLTSNIAHELRTPLAVMKANVEAMMDGVVACPEAGLETIRIEVESLIRLVEGIEDITKAEASFFSRKESQFFELHEFLTGIVSKLLPLAIEKGLVLEIKESGRLPVYADREKLEKVVQNILVNALKNTVAGRVSIKYGSDKTTFFLEIRDTGIGIPAEIREKVFRRFYRGEASKGIGLGLAIVKELVDVMGGSIELLSSIGEGSTFIVHLPLKG